MAHLADCHQCDETAEHWILQCSEVGRHGLSVVGIWFSSDPWHDGHLSRSYRKESFPRCSSTSSWKFGPRKGLNFVGYFLDYQGCRDIFYATTFGSVFCFAKGGCSQGSAAGQAPAAKGPPVPKTGGTPMVQGPPVRPSSDSAVMAKAGTTDPQAKGPLQGQFPTPAESVGKSAPVKKPPPTGKPKQRASSLSLKAAYACMSSTATPGTGVSAPSTNSRGALLRHLLERTSQ